MENLDEAPSVEIDPAGERNWDRPPLGAEALGTVAVLLLLPLMIDLAILPVTGIHDLWAS